MSSLSPNPGGFLYQPAPPVRPIDWEDIEQGPGQLFAPISHIQWGGERNEFEVRVVEAPVIVERFDFPNRPRPKDHGGHR